MRNRSIAVPLFLIVIGALLLLHNLRPDISLWHEIAFYWPFLLIAFGIVRLVEVFFDAGRGKPLSPGTSYAGIFALVAVCIVIWAVTRRADSFPFGSIGANSIQIFGEEYDFEVHQSQEFPKAKRLVLDGLHGDIVINGDSESAVRLDGRKLVHSMNQVVANDLANATKLELVEEGDAVVLRATGPETPYGGGGPFHREARLSVDLNIKVPQRMSVESRGRSGDLTIEKVDGMVNVTAQRGDVRLNEIGGNARVELNRSGLLRASALKGGLDLSGSGSDIQLEDIAGAVTIDGTYSGTLDFQKLSKPLRFTSRQTDLYIEKISGTVNMDLGDFRATDVTGPIRLTTTSRDVHLEDFQGEVEVQLDRGDVELKPTDKAVAKISVRTKSGDVELALPENAPVDLTATVAQGEINNEYGDAAKTETQGRTGKLRLTQGKGAIVNLNSDRGTVTLRKS